jgi:hypothetical protein
LEQNADISLIMVREVSETRFGPKLIQLVAQENFMDNMKK